MGTVGSECGVLRVLALAMCYVLPGRSRQGARPYRRMGAGYPAKPNSKCGLNIARRCHSVRQGGQHICCVRRCDVYSHRCLTTPTIRMTGVFSDSCRKIAFTPVLLLV
jgi:hypothetical protein